MDENFEWDDAKARENLRKHKVGFAEARTIFGDPYSITIFDVDHSNGEQRYIDLGMSRNRRLLVVVYLLRGDMIRLISARKATAIERRKYEERTAESD